MAQVTKETKIGELLQLDKDVSPILFSIGLSRMSCITGRDYRGSCNGSRRKC